jgi:hypothetical protein
MGNLKNGWNGKFKKMDRIGSLKIAQNRKIFKKIHGMGSFKKCSDWKI